MTLIKHDDRVTIGLYSTQNSSSFNMEIEIKNIEKIKTKFTAAAENYNRKPPEFIVILNLIPDWKNDSDYSNDKYQKDKDSLIEKFKNKLNDEKLSGITLEYFYTRKDLQECEKGYLNQLVAKGSNADMIKNHAIICNENKERCHLQLDSNTKISNYKELYSQTFGAKEEEQKDALNASFYDKNYVSAHNKIVYTTGYQSKQKIAKYLRTIHLEYCEHHRDDHKIKDSEEKTKKNSIYSKDFTEALSEAKLTSKKTINNNNNKKTIYPAIMTENEYRITKNVITAVNMTWKDEKPLENIDDLKKLPPIEIYDAECDIACFINAVKKYTADLTGHYDDPYDDTKAHKELIAISNKDTEQEMIKKFILQVANTHENMLAQVIRIIPMYDKRGKILITELFGCKAEEVDQLSEKLEKSGNMEEIKELILQLDNKNKDDQASILGENLKEVNFPSQISGAGQQGFFKPRNEDSLVVPPAQPAANQNLANDEDIQKQQEEIQAFYARELSKKQA